MEDQSKWKTSRSGRLVEVFDTTVYDIVGGVIGESLISTVGWISLLELLVDVH